ncbi:hypothetical protein E2C01_052841 [Portunus trituberculatus]|uniref:Uncharacterized protein n=1 Tax=Portunus trituberculatus TaxID=210409 RepID=A0A5B7GFM5_PORTR|nr:hypothetical protein [Portunus trituberculatus]
MLPVRRSVPSRVSTREGTWHEMRKIRPKVACSKLEESENSHVWRLRQEQRLTCGSLAAGHCSHPSRQVFDECVLTVVLKCQMVELRMLSEVEPRYLHTSAATTPAGLWEAVLTPAVVQGGRCWR